MSKLNEPIFIVGCGHSGTSILFRILSNHKNIYGIYYPDTTLETNIFIKNQANYNVFKKWENETIKNNKQRFIEKTPRHVYFIDEILKFYPNAKIIVCVRNGFDNILSLIKNRPKEYDFDKALNRWVNDNNEWYCKYNKDNMYVVKLENLQKNPENTISNILSFLNEEYEPTILSYHTKKINIEINNNCSQIEHKKNRNKQINEKIYVSQNYNLSTLQYNELIADEKFIDVMRKLNYDLIKS